MRGQPREARQYELMTIFSPDVPEEEIGGQIERIAGFVTDAGGTVQDTRRDSPWGRRRLAYPIRHGGRDLRDGFYTLFHIELEPHRIDDLERDLKLNDILIRHLVTTYVPQPIDPRAVEDAEVAAEDAAAEAYAAAQAEAALLAAPAASNGDLGGTVLTPTSSESTNSPVSDAPDGATASDPVATDSAPDVDTSISSPLTAPLEAGSATEAVVTDADDDAPALDAPATTAVTDEDTVTGDAVVDAPTVANDEESESPAVDEDVAMKTDDSDNDSENPDDVDVPKTEEA